MSSKEGFTATTAAPPRLGNYVLYTPSAVRQHHQGLLPHQQMMQRRLPLQQLQQQQQQQQQLELQKMDTAKQDFTSEAEAEAEERCDADDSSIAAALAVPGSVSSAPAANVTNLDRLMESVTPVVQARYLSEVNASRRGTQEENGKPFFYLADLWESFNEWSAYGAAVPFLLNGREPIEQYYVPFLSGIQLYIDQSKRSSRLGGLNEESDTESCWLTGVTDRGVSEGDKKAKSVLNLNMQQLNRLRLSLGDKFIMNPSSSEAAINNLPGSPVFQFLEYEQPYNRRPLTDKMSMLASEFPELSTFRSCDLLPISWICVAWYPIYRIPVGPTLQDLEASFLTFHSLSTQSKDKHRPQFYAPNTKTVSSGVVDSASKISLPVFALASYKLKGSILSPCGPLECEQENSLLQAADNWLRCLQVMLPDYQFFRAHYNQWR